MTEVDLTWFQPGPKKQLPFLRTTAKESAYIGGRGTGKTVVGAVRATLMAMQYPGIDGLVGRQTYRALEDTTKRVILEGANGLPPTLPPAAIRRYYPSDKMVELVNGSRIFFRSFQDFNVEKLRSFNLGWFWLDEASESSESVYSELMAAMRAKDSPRQAWVTSNPNGHDWLWWRFHPDSPQSAGRVLIHAITGEDIPLSDDFMAWMHSQPDEWKKRYLYASFDTASGQIFSEWNPQIHVVPHVALPREWRTIEAIDHGERNPTCWLLARVDNDGNVWFEDEYYQAGLRTSVHIEAIKSKRAQYGLDHRTPIVCDPSMFATRIEGISAADAYRTAGIRLKPGVNNRDVTYTRVADYLHPMPEDVFPSLHPLAGTHGPGEPPIGAPRMFVMRSCKNLIREFPEYLWKDYSPSLAESRELPEEPRKLNDHAIDAARYLLAEMPKPRSEPKFTEPPKPERRKAQTAGVRTRTF